MRNKSHLTIQSKGGMLKTQSEGMHTNNNFRGLPIQKENNERQRHCKKIKEILSTAGKILLKVQIQVLPVEVDLLGVGIELYRLQHTR